MDKLTHELITEIIKSRKYNYSNEPLDRFLRVHASVRCNHFSLKNKHNQTLSAMILKQSYTDTCIVYAHGLGSNKLEVLPVAQYFLELGFNVCAFDFSGSGRSEGEHTTYGVRQQDDINAVLAWLDASRQYQRYILWGRSMGGTSILMSQSRNTNQKVQCIVLDSPFSSFERVAIEIASKSSFVPTVLIQLLIDPLRREFQRQYPHLNPFNSNILGTAEKINNKMIIIYSKNDRIISYQHSKQIIRSCKRSPIEIEIEEDHNKQRKKKTYGLIKRYIEDCMDQHDRKAKRSRSKGRGISVTSKQTQKYHKYKTSICSSVLTQKSINAEFIQQPIMTEVQITNSSKKPAMIKSILMKTSKAKRVSNLQFTDKQNKQNTRALINFRHRKRKLQKSIIGCFQ